MISAVPAMMKHRDLLLMIAWRDIKIKYKQSVIGILWAVLMPIIIISAGVLVRYAIANLSGEPLTSKAITAVSVKAVPWAFFVATIRFTTSSLISNAALVTKIYMPRVIFPIAAALSQFVDFAVAAVPLAIILSFAGVGASVHLLWVPFLVFLLVLQVMALGIFLSGAALFFRDVKYLVEVTLTFAIFFTPVFYEVEMFGSAGNYLLLNPIAPILDGLSAVVINHEMPRTLWLLYSGVIGVVGFAIALVSFRKLEPYFAESI